MKYLVLISLIMSMSLKLPAQINREDISKAIEEIRTKFAPDKRTAVFDIIFIAEGGKIVFSGETNLPEAKHELFSLFEKKEIEDKIDILPLKELGTKIFGIVNLSVANIRSKPDHTAELSTQVLLGSKLKILKSSKEWYYVQCEDDYLGWVDDDGVAMMDQQYFDEWIQAEKVIVTSAFTFAYSEPNTSSVPVSDVVIGDLLKYISTEDGYVRVEFPDGRLGFISNDQIENYQQWFNSRELTFNSINRTAHSMLGVPYVWGGTSIKGVDCSGFTKLVFQLNGIRLPRDASQQVFVGELIDTKNGFDKLIPGDLLFFGIKDQITSKERITHVAIYIGNLEFIHSSGRVRINSFDKSMKNFAAGRLKTFVIAKRILGFLGTKGIKQLN